MSLSGTGPGDRATIFFQGKPLFALADKGGHRSIRERSLPLIKRLSHHWQSGRPLPLRVRDAGDHAEIDLEGSVLLNVLPQDCCGAPAGRTAREWAGDIERSFRLGGRVATVDEAP